MVALVVAAVAAHRLDGDGFGLFASVAAAGFLANALVTFGTDTVVTRAIAAERADSSEIAGASLAFQMCASGCLATAAGIAVALGANTAILVQAVALIPMAVVTVTGAVLRGRQQMDRLLVASTVGGIAALASLFFGFWLAVEPWVPVAALGVGTAVKAAVSVAFVAPLDSWHERVTVARVTALAREAAPFATMVVLAAAAAQAGILLVEFVSDASAGGYGVAVRLAEASRLVPAAAMGAFFPAMLSGLHRTARYRRWLRWLVVYAVVATGALLALATPINDIVFDSQPGGATLTRILALGLVFTVLRLALSFEFIAQGRERAVLISTIAATIVTIGGGAALAPKFGPNAVAWSEVVGVMVATAVLVLRSDSSESAESPLVAVGEALGRNVASE